MSQYQYASDALQDASGDAKGNFTATESLMATPAVIGGISYEYGGSRNHPVLRTLCPDDGGWRAKWERMREMRERLLINSHDNVNFNLYITEITELDQPKFQNRFCKLLRTLSENQTLHIHTGNFVYGYFPAYNMGCLLDAIMRARCKVITHINGRASFTETVLWMYGHERQISEFGTILFVGMQDRFKWSPEWYDHFAKMYTRAVELKLLTEEEKTMCLTSNKCVQLTYDEIVNRLHAAEPDRGIDD